MVSGQPPASTMATNGHITEDEASLYDRQIRLWGLDAQNRMRNSTVLVLSLRGLAHETIKNLVLAGIGRMIVMDGGKVTEEDLGCGFLFREEEGAVGTERTAAALPQIASLNPLVSLTALPTLAPFVGGTEDDMVAFLQKEKVDVVVACDLPRTQMEAIDAAARSAGSNFFGAGTYGFYGYAFADLGEQYEFVFTNHASTGESPVKKVASFAPLSAVVDRSHWDLPWTETAKGGSPFRGVLRMDLRQFQADLQLGILSVWEYEARHGALPSSPVAVAELRAIFDELVAALGVNPKGRGIADPDALIAHLASHSTHFFPPTLAIVGGLLAQDVLRVLSRKNTPITNLVAIDSLRGASSVYSWAMAEAVETKEV